jgi:hypothetical protein
MLSVLLIQIIQLLHLSEPAQVVPINVKPLTVCEILADLAKYRGNVIQVRDEWLGTNLYGRDCAPPQTGDYVWEPAIWLIEPASPILEKEGTPASWKLDQRESLRSGYSRTVAEEDCERDIHRTFRRALGGSSNIARRWQWIWSSRSVSGTTRDCHR